MEDSFMKNVLMLIAMLFASVQLRASHLASELNLRMFDHSWITVNIDNQEFTTPVTRFNTGHLNPGNHWITVLRYSEGNFGHYAQPMVVFSGYVNIPAASRLNAMIDRQFRFRINKVIPLAPAPVVYAPVFNECAPVPVVYGMNEYDFRQLVRTIDRLSFESSKMQVARQAISVNMLTSQQVAQLVGLMTFESSKLDLAKFAYHNTVDKQNYFIINDMFTFESSIMDLNSFIYRS